MAWTLVMAIGTLALCIALAWGLAACGDDAERAAPASAGTRGPVPAVEAEPETEPESDPQPEPGPEPEALPAILPGNASREELEAACFVGNHDACDRLGH